jgi:myo-inositol-1(or 4)-monophosphatase
MQLVARKAGYFIKNEQKKLKSSDIEVKSASCLVTYVDKTAEEMIVSDLSELIQGSGFVTEEGTAAYNNEEYMWIIDPLDGTTNYLHGLTPYSVSIGLMERNEIVAGVVYEVAGDQMFFAWKGSRAFCNKNVLTVSKTKTIDDTLIATGFPYYDFEQTEKYTAALKELMMKTRGLRRFGSAAVDLCYVAAGKFDAFYEHALHAWDIAAGILILKQAGGKVSDFNGGENWLFGGELVAASSEFYPEFYKIIHKHFGNKF